MPGFFPFRFWPHAVAYCGVGFGFIPRVGFVLKHSTADRRTITAYKLVRSAKSSQSTIPSLFRSALPHE